MACYISPFDPAGIMKAIVGYMDPKARQEAEARIAKSYKPWTWKDSASSFLTILDHNKSLTR